MQVQSIPAPPVLMQIPVLPYMLPRPSHLFPVMPARLPNVNFHSQPECDPLSIPLLSVPVPGSAFGLDDDALAWEKPSSLDLLFVDVLSDSPFISSDLMRSFAPGYSTTNLTSSVVFGPVFYTRVVTAPLCISLLGFFWSRVCQLFILSVRVV